MQNNSLTKQEQTKYYKYHTAKINNTNTTPSHIRVHYFMDVIDTSFSPFVVAPLMSVVGSVWQFTL